MKTLMVLFCCLLTACAGSPARNALDGKGLVCTPPMCSPRGLDPWVEREFNKRLTEARIREDDNRNRAQQHDAVYAERVKRAVQREQDNARIIAQYVPPAAELFSLPKSYQQAVKRHLDDVLKDEPSARYKDWSSVPSYVVTYKPSPDQFSDCGSSDDRLQLEFGGSVVRVRKCMPDSVDTIRPSINVHVQINAKNGFGGYTGWKEYVCTFTSPTHISSCK